MMTAVEAIWDFNFRYTQKYGIGYSGYVVFANNGSIA